MQACRRTSLSEGQRDDFQPFFSRHEYSQRRLQVWLYEMVYLVSIHSNMRLLYEVSNNFTSYGEAKMLHRLTIHSHWPENDCTICRLRMWIVCPRNVQVMSEVSSSSQLAHPLCIGFTGLQHAVASFRSIHITCGDVIDSLVLLTP